MQVKSFDVNPGGYIGYFDPKTGKHETFFTKATRSQQSAANSPAKRLHDFRRSA
jgi:hypothetical protein